MALAQLSRLRHHNSAHLADLPEDSRVVRSLVARELAQLPLQRQPQPQRLLFQQQPPLRQLQLLQQRRARRRRLSNLHPATLRQMQLPKVPLPRQQRQLLPQLKPPSQQQHPEHSPVMPHRLALVPFKYRSQYRTFQDQQINAQAIPWLEQQTIAAQSANIQGVGGASYTSQGFYQSLVSALSKAGM